MIKRQLFQEIKKHLKQKEISMVMGPRQVGKTTLMKQLKDYLEKRNEGCVFLSLDFERDRPFFRSQEALIDKLRLELGSHSGFVFIDEVQRKKDAGLFFKGLFDLELPYKFIVSGSGSLELKENLHESLVGRKRIFRLAPVSFEEFIDYCTGYRYEGRLDEFFQIEREKTVSLIRKYMNFGGYPRVITEEKAEEKRKIIDEIFSSYLEKDIGYFLGAEKSYIFSDLIRITADQAGNPVNYSELSRTSGLSLQTVRKYLWYAQKTFILHKIRPFFRNVRKEIRKSPVYYFYDLGLRNHALGLFGHIETPGMFGFLFENLVFHKLKESMSYGGGKISYWRTTEGAEVDFVLDFGSRFIPVEVKYSEYRRPRISRSMRSFASKYRPERVYIINRNFHESLVKEGVEYIFLPFVRLDDIKLTP